MFVLDDDADIEVLNASGQNVFFADVCDVKLTDE